MAYPVVAEVSRQTRAASTSHTINYPASVDVDELLLCIFEVGDDVAPTVSGWTNVFSADTTNYWHAGFALKAAGSEGGGTFTITFASSEAIVVHLYRIQSWGGTIATHVLEAHATEVANDNPPNLNMGSSQDYLMIAGCGLGASTATISAAPANYTNLISDLANLVLLGTARRNLTASSEDPGAFTVSAGALSAFTIAVAPGSAGPAPDDDATGTGALTLPFLSLAATGQHRQLGTSALTLPFLSLAGVGLMQPEGTASLSLPFLVLTATGEQAHVGSAALALPFLALAGTGMQRLAGTGALALPFIALSSVGTHPFVGTAALSLPFLSLSATGLLRQIASGALTLPFPIVAGTGSHGLHTGSGALTLPFPLLAAAGFMVPEGTAALSLPFPVLSATGLHRHIATAALELPFPVLAASGVQALTGSGALTLPFIVLEGDGTSVLLYTGVGAFSLPFPVFAAMGYHKGKTGQMGGMARLRRPQMGGRARVNTIKGQPL